MERLLSDVRDELDTDLEHQKLGIVLTGLSTGVGVWATATFFDAVVRAPEAVVIITTLLAAGITPAVTWYVLSKNGV
ncbi:hypothetical protein KU306_12240 [Haloferax larsenii]|uniref:Uncharacterized protein n=1 Tax=Haloferax larsenii TaxID=302484 RepID=A0ABY5RDY9_HALLR|nr:hypothetical protein [Haloferax larsenii]UVE49673.1 hypothetical protein KU306_12240 [Haloferax larsenii]